MMDDDWLDEEAAYYYCCKNREYVDSNTATWLGCTWMILAAGGVMIIILHIIFGG